MAAAPPGGPALPVPAQAPARFANLYADAQLDPTGGNPALLLDKFYHDVVNGANNVDTRALKTSLAISGAQNQLIAVTVVAGQKARIYNCIFRWEDGLLANNPTLANKFFALEGELIGNQGHVVEIPGGVFDLLQNVVAVPTPAMIETAYAADENATQLGPYDANDAGVDLVKTRRAVPIPHFLAGVWVAELDGIDAPTFWRRCYPIIVAAGKEAECKALLEFFQVAVTIPPNGVDGDDSLVDTARPAPPPRSPALVARVQELLEHHFVQLRRDAAAHQTNQIATALGTLAQQNQDHYEEGRRERAAAKDATVSKMLGADNLRRLLTMARKPNEARLVAACPFYKKLAEVPKSQRLGVLDSQIQAAMEDKGHTYLSFPTSAGLLSSILGLRWDMISEDAITTGVLGNPFLFGDTDEEQQQAVNLRVNMMESGGAAMSSSDAAALLKMDINPPGENESIDNVRRMDALCSILLPDAHPFRTYITDHLAALESYLPKWKRLEVSDPSLQAAKGVLHLQYLALRCTRYWREQSTNMAAVSLPSPTELFEEADYQRPWEPQLSTSLRAKLNLDAMSFGGGSIPGAIPASDQSTLSGLTAATLRSLLTGHGGDGGGGGAGSGSTAGGGQSTRNPDFNEVLFGEYRNRTVNGQPVKARDLRLKIHRGELPELPTSIYCTTSPMCPAWHIKGMCNPSCPRAADHKVYTATQYQPLVDWCGANYPS